MASTAADMQVDEGVARHTPIEVDTPSPPAEVPPRSTVNPPPVSETNVLQARKKAKAPSSVTASPADPASAGANGSSTPTTLSTKPKSTKPTSSIAANGHKPRTPSPSPPPPPVRPALQTIRLEIKLGGFEDYEIDISQLSKETGQRPPTPPRAVSPQHDESSESEPEATKDDVKPKKKRKRVSRTFASRRQRLKRVNRRMQRKSITTSRTPSLTTLNLPSTSEHSLHKRNSRDSTSRQGRSLYSQTSASPAPRLLNAAHTIPSGLSRRRVRDVQAKSSTFFRPPPPSQPHSQTHSSLRLHLCQHRAPSSTLPASCPFPKLACLPLTVVPCLLDLHVWRSPSHRKALLTGPAERRTHQYLSTWTTCASHQARAPSRGKSQSRRTKDSRPVVVWLALGWTATQKSGKRPSRLCVLQHNIYDIIDLPYSGRSIQILRQLSPSCRRQSPKVCCPSSCA